MWVVDGATGVDSGAKVQATDIHNHFLGIRMSSYIPMRWVFPAHGNYAFVNQGSRSPPFVVSAVVYRDVRKVMGRVHSTHEHVTLLMLPHLTKCTELFVV
jgi:hypothetical protein